MSTYYCESCLTGENKYIDGGDLSIPLPGIPNVGFDIGSGVNNQINSVKLQSDGKILVGGYFTSYSGVAKNYIVRLNTDGSVDDSFVNGSGFTSYVSDIEVQTDGKILVVGGFTSYSGVARNYIIRLNTDGSIDNSFSIGSGLNLPPYDLELQSDGKILVGGYFTSYSGVSVGASLIRLNTNGSIDNTFNTGSGFYNTYGEGGDGSVFAIQYQPDGKIIVGGGFTQYNGAYIGSGIVRLNSDGTRDVSWNSGTGIDEATVFSIALQSDGKVLIGGNFITFGGSIDNYIVRLNSNGGKDGSFVIGTGFDNNVRDIEVQSDGKILVGGDFTTYSGVSKNRIIKLNSDGSIDSSFVTGFGFDGSVISFVTNSNGKIIVGGSSFTKFNGYFCNRICQLDSLDNNPILYTTDSSCYEALNESFNNINPLFDIGTGFNNAVFNIQTQTDGKILVGGDFTSYSGVSINRIIRLNTDYTVDTSFVIGTGFNNRVTVITPQSDGKLLVGGLFTSYSSVTKNRIVRLNTDGSIDNSFSIGTGFTSNVNSIEIQTDGKILVGGYFSSYSGVSRNCIVRLNTDGSIDSSFVIGTGFTANSVFKINIQSDGKILVGGNFTSYSGVSINRIIRLNTGGSIDSSFVVGTGFNSIVWDIEVQSDGKILVVGTFTTYSGSSRNRIIRLNSDGSIDSSFSIGSGFAGNVYASALQSDGKILAGGPFNSYNGLSEGEIVRLNSDGSIDTNFNVGSGFNQGSEIYSIKLQSNGNILVGGNFTEIANLNAYKFTGLLSVPLESEYTALELFSECEICNGYVIPISANTEYIDCLICDGSASLVSVPHPVWIGLNGGSVTQMNAVLLGGNGLNS